MSKVSTAPLSEFSLYETEDGRTRVECRFIDNSLWLSQTQMVELFQSSKQNISLHVKNVLTEGELQAAATVKEYLTVQQEGNRRVKREVKIYNLDVIISVGYRVKSQRGTQFRIWANKILKEYLLNLNRSSLTAKRTTNNEQRITNIDQRQKPKAKS